MIGFILALAATQPVDQTVDAASVGAYLHALRTDPALANKMTTSDVVVLDTRNQQSRSLDSFAAYANECAIKEIRAVGGSARLPIDTVWYCGGLKPDRQASFWFEGDKIKKISWGAPMVVHVRPAGQD